MSASRPEADIRAGLQHVCFVPPATDIANVRAAKKKPPAGGLSIQSAELRSGGHQCWLRLPTIGHEGHACEAEDHHCPCGGLGDARNCYCCHCGRDILPLNISQKILSVSEPYRNTIEIKDRPSERGNHSISFRITRIVVVECFNIDERTRTQILKNVKNCACDERISRTVEIYIGLREKGIKRISRKRTGLRQWAPSLNQYPIVRRSADAGEIVGNGNRMFGIHDVCFCSGHSEEKTAENDSTQPATIHFCPPYRDLVALDRRFP
jgi:hypothetical protein